MCLTSDQESHLLQLRERYLDMACGGGRIDHTELQSALIDAYAAVGRPPPQLLVFDSPAACLKAMSMIGISLVVESDVGLWAQIEKQIWYQIRKEVGEAARNQIEEIHAWIKGRLRRQLALQIMSLLGECPENRNAWHSNFSWGSHDLHLAALGAFAKYLGITLDPDLCREVALLEQIGSQCEWWWPFEGIVVASQRPVTVAWDSQHRLHCENGPAVEYADGFAMFVWHGLRVPDHWIKDRDSLDPNEVIQQKNVELRAAGAAIAGWPKMLSVLKCRVIDDSGSDDIGQLIELTLPGLHVPGRFLKAVCPRNGVIIEGVPRVSDIDNLPINTAIAAQAWRIGDPQCEYQHPPRRT